VLCWARTRRTRRRVPRRTKPRQKALPATHPASLAELGRKLLYGRPKNLILSHDINPPDAPRPQNGATGSVAAAWQNSQPND